MKARAYENRAHDALSKEFEYGRVAVQRVRSDQAQQTSARLALGLDWLCPYHPAVAMVMEKGTRDGAQLTATSVLPPADRMFEKPALTPHA